MTSTKLGAAAALLGLAGCADVLDLTAYEPTGTGGAGAATTTSAGGSGGSTTTSAGGSGGAVTTTSMGGEGGGTTTSTGGEGGGTTTTTGVPTECEPGTTAPCYSGPPLTEGIGACKPGARTCDPAGQWGACEGEVTPKIEVCATHSIDESCDNLAKCAGAFRWARRFGGGLDQTPGIPAVAADGGLVLTGVAAGPLDFGAGPLPEGAGLDLFLARLDRDGKHLWSKRFGGPDDEAGVAVAVDAAGNILLAGQAAGTQVDLGGGPLANAGFTDLLIAKLTPEGAHLWSRTWGTTAPENANAVAVDAAGDVFVAGRSQLTDSGDIVLLKLSGRDGATLWEKTFPHAGVQAAAGLAAAPNGDVILFGAGPGGVDFGGGATPAFGGVDAFAARFDTAGTHVWSHAYGGAATDYAGALALDAAGNAVLIGSTDGTFAFGAPVPSATTAGALDVAVWRVKADGTTEWGSLFGGVAAQYGLGVAVDSLGNVVVSGTFATEITFDKKLDAVAPFDRFLAKLDPAGAVIWSQRFDNGGASFPRVAADPLGNITYTSLLLGTTDLGGGPLTSADADIVAGSFTP